MKLLNAFSLSMLDGDHGAEVRCVPLSARDARDLARSAWGSRSADSYVGHPDTAAVFAEALDVSVPVRRESCRMPVLDDALVGQYGGPRLPEGATSLPDGAVIRWWYVRIERSALDTAQRDFAGLTRRLEP